VLSPSCRCSKLASPFAMVWLQCNCNGQFIYLKGDVNEKSYFSDLFICVKNVKIRHLKFDKLSISISNWKHYSTDLFHSIKSPAKISPFTKFQARKYKDSVEVHFKILKEIEPFIHHPYVKFVLNILRQRLTLSWSTVFLCL
jgi:hypothetical protein